MARTSCWRHSVESRSFGDPSWRRVDQNVTAWSWSLDTWMTKSRSVIEDIPAQVVHNSDFESGMATSIIVGLREAIRLRAAGVMICLSDMPDLTSEHLDLLATKFRQCDGKPIVRAVAAGEPGHPIIFPDSTYPELEKLAGDVGAREVVRHHWRSIVDVEIGPAARTDLDTLESLRKRGWLAAKG